LASIEGVVLCHVSVTSITCEVLVHSDFNWLKLFLFIDCVVFVIVNQNRIVRCCLSLRLLIISLDSSTYKLPKCSVVEVVELVVLKILGVIDEGLWLVVFVQLLVV
jgi:hypothetical protein